VHWLASTACTFFGQDHYPTGIYVPNLVRKQADLSFVHPRKRVCDCLENGAVVLINLKNREKKQSAEEKEWYDFAFGKYRNMMEFGATYIPKNQDGLHNFYVRIEYQMFKEMYDESFGEFSVEDFPESQDIPMKHVINDDDQDEYNVDIMLPYGYIDTKKIVFDLIEGPKGEENERKEVAPNTHVNFQWRGPEPHPYSLDSQRQENAEEEARNKEVERTKRAEQKERLEKEKRELAEQ